MFKKTTYSVKPEIGAIGSMLTVTTKELFRKPVVVTYKCYAFDPFMGSKWHNTETLQICSEAIDNTLASEAQKAVPAYVAAIRKERGLPPE